MKMKDGRKTAGDAWRHKAQDFFEDINSPELIIPEVPLNEKMEMWSLYMDQLKKIAKDGTEEEKNMLQHMYGFAATGEVEDDSDDVFEDIGHVKTDKTKTTYNMTIPELEEAVKAKVPKHAFYDLYNQFFTPNSEMKIKPAPEELRWMEKLLLNSNNPYTKAITENIPIYSYIAATEVVKALLTAGYEFNEQSMGNANNGAIQKVVDKAMSSAQDQMDQMDDVADTVGAGKMDSDISFKDMASLSEYYNVMKDVPLKDELLRDFIKNTLKLSKSYFSSRYTEVEENIFEVDQLEDLEGLENLLPPLDLIALNDIVTHERVYFNKVNLYIDRSGSMSSYWGYNGRYQSFTDKDGNLEELGMAKLTALKLNAMGEVNEIRCFDGNVKEKPMSVRDTIFLNTGGGTNIDRVIEHVEKMQTPSIILTDMGDSIHEYSPDVYFIGVGSARFSQFLHTDVGKLYLKNHQCVKYDSNDNVFVKLNLTNATHH